MCVLPLTAAGFSPADGTHRLLSRRQSGRQSRNGKPWGKGIAKKNRRWCGAAWTPHQRAFVPLLRGVLQHRLLRRLQHRGGFLGDGRALEEAWVLRTPEPHRIGEDEVAEIVIRQNPV